MNHKFIKIFTTVGNKKDAFKMAEFLINKHLAACVQIAPIESVYNWKGKIEKSKEWLVSIKTKKLLYSKVEKAIKNLHSYELPEIIAVPIIKGSREFLNWMSEEVK